MPKTVSCPQECVHWREGHKEQLSASEQAMTFRIDWYAGSSGYHFVCMKGHKPRFYEPGKLKNWGWKRRCDDVEEE